MPPWGGGSEVLVAGEGEGVVPAAVEGGGEACRILHSVLQQGSMGRGACCPGGRGRGLLAIQLRDLNVLTVILIVVTAGAV